MLIEIAKKGGEAVGVETSESYISESHAKAKEEGVALAIVHGRGERLPFQNGTFDFVNMTEVIEHVHDPGQVLSEVFRVLRPHGEAYVSAPNRFGFKDPHFHLYLVNWLPRALASVFISLWGTHKDYADTQSGFQRLEEMHYYTLGQIRGLCRRTGFRVIDIRAQKLKKKFGLAYPLIFCIYALLRFCYFDSFHLRLIKNT